MDMKRTLEKNHTLFCVNEGCKMSINRRRKAVSDF